MQGNQPADLASIQFLRGVAATMVVFHHALGQFAGIHNLLPTEEGAMGVDLFFVISGFVMTYTTARAGYSAGDFLKRRAVRIVPLYWVMTALVAVLLFLAAELVNNSRFTLDSFLQSLFFIPHENPGMPGSITPMLKLGWTLNFEVFIYLVFAALIWMRPAQRTLALALAFLALVWFAQALHPRWAPVAFWADTILFEFVFGCCIAVLFLNGAFVRVPRWAWLCILIAALIVMGFVGFRAPPGPWRFLSYGAPTAFILMAVVALEQQSASAWRNGPLRFIGDASYSIHRTPLRGHRFPHCLAAPALAGRHLAVRAAVSRRLRGGRRHRRRRDVHVHRAPGD